MSKILTILMLGGAKRVSLAEKLIAAGKKHDIDVRIYSHELDMREPIASVGKIIVGKKYSDEGVMSELREIIKGYKVDVVLPFIDPAIEIAQLCAEQFKVFSPTSSHDTIVKLFDKVESASLFEDNDIPVPATLSPDNMHYPAILKPRCGSASKGIVVVNNDAEFLPFNGNTAYLVQEYIANRDEYTVDCYIGMNDGEIKCIVPRIRIATAGGEVTKTQTCRIPQLIGLSEYVIKKLNLKGAVTLQFLQDKSTNRFLLMEINPRLGGGVICSINAGADIAEMIINEAAGNNATPVKIWRDGTLMTRYFQEVMFYNDGIK